MAAHGPWFEHYLGLNPWDLERMTSAQVAYRLDFVKAMIRARGEEGEA